MSTVNAIVREMLEDDEGDEEFSPRDYVVNGFRPVIGYVAHLTGGALCSWRSIVYDVQSTNQAHRANGWWRYSIQDADVLSEKEVQRLMRIYADDEGGLEIFPVYSEPALTGMGALDPDYDPLRGVLESDDSREDVPDEDGDEEFDPRGYVVNDQFSEELAKLGYGYGSDFEGSGFEKFLFSSEGNTKHYLSIQKIAGDDDEYVLLVYIVATPRPVYVWSRCCKKAWLGQVLPNLESGIKSLWDQDVSWDNKQRALNALATP